MLNNKTTVADLNDPVAVFDAGIGSYALVELIRHSQPQRDIIYFADRANFPTAPKVVTSCFPSCAARSIV